MTRMTGPDCVVMCNLINTYIHIHIHTYIHNTSIPPWEDQCEWHRMTRMTGPDCAVMCNLINIHNTYIHTYILSPKSKTRDNNNPKPIYLNLPSVGCMYCYSSSGYWYQYNSKYSSMELFFNSSAVRIPRFIEAAEISTRALLLLLSYKEEIRHWTYIIFLETYIIS